MRTCSFCNKPENEVKTLVGPGPFICNKCVQDASEAVGAQQETSAFKKPSVIQIQSPREIKASLDEDVIGQERAKRALSVAVYNHHRRRESVRAGKPMAADFQGVEIQKSNILLMGPSGTGKTESARSVARTLGLPFYVADATKLTQAGYVGDDVESMLQGLIAAANHDPEQAKFGIIFLDEGDKLARKSGRGASGYRDVSGEGVQQSLLKLIEGSVVSVPDGGAKMGMGGSQTMLDTTNILFIFAGSFDGIQEIISKRANKSARLGFGGEARKELSQAEVYGAVTEEDVLEFGLIPELLGRLPVLTTTLPLSDEDMVRVLTEPRNSLIKQFRALFAMDKIDLQFDPEALIAIGREAKKRPTGARALRSILEGLLEPYSFQYRGDPSVKAIRITPDVVAGKAEPLIVFQAQEVASLA